MIIKQLKRNIVNLRLPYLILEDGSEVLVNTMVLAKVYGYDKNYALNVIGKEYNKKIIFKAYQELIKVNVSDVQREIDKLKSQGITKGFYKHLPMTYKNIYDHMKTYDLLGELNLK